MTVVPYEQATEEVPPAYSPSSTGKDGPMEALLQDTKTHLLLEHPAFAPPNYTPATTGPPSPTISDPPLHISSPFSDPTSNSKSLIIAPRPVSPVSFKHTPMLLKDFGITEEFWIKEFLAPLRAATSLQRGQKALIAAAGIGLAVVTNGPIVPAIVGYVVWRKEILKNLNKGLRGEMSRFDVEQRTTEIGEKKDQQGQTVRDVLANFNARLAPEGVKVSLLLPEKEERKKGCYNRKYAQECCTTRGVCNGADIVEGKEAERCCKCCREGGWGCKGGRGKGCKGRTESCRERRERRSVRVLVEKVGGEQSIVEKGKEEV